MFIFFLEHILKPIFAFSIPSLVKVYYCLMCLKVHVWECVLLLKCVHMYTFVCVCVCVWDYKAWLIQMRDRAGYHTGTRHSECMHAFVSDCLYFNELGLSLQCCTLQQLFTQDKCDNNPPPPHPADYPPLTHIHILTFSPKYHKLAHAHIPSTVQKRVVGLLSNTACQHWWLLKG